MFQQNLVLLVAFAMGIAFNNSLVAGAAACLLILKIIRLDSMLLLLERRALEAGLLLLTVAVLVPFATGKVSTKEVVRTFTGTDGLAALVAGVIAAYICGRGVVLLQSTPQVIVGLVIGTLLGVFLLKGVPVGPLAAAGLAALFMQLFRWVKRG